MPKVTSTIWGGSKIKTIKALSLSSNKSGFNQRRKTLRNALSSLINKDNMGDDPLFELRAERLGVTDFVKLTNLISLKR